MEPVASGHTTFELVMSYMQQKESTGEVLLRYMDSSYDFIARRVDFIGSIIADNLAAYHLEQIQ